MISLLCPKTSSDALNIDIIEAKFILEIIESTYECWDNGKYFILMELKNLSKERIEKKNCEFSLLPVF